ncbi:MAG: PHP domain-containing protein [Eubacteriaceae bacterium]|nr:PHP domain-containing protein [Eubacteriaceae bacterium]
MYRMIFDYHTHTIYSKNGHGKGTIEENVREAVRKGLEGIAITDHGPGHLTYGVKRKNFPVMRKEIERLKKAYPEIKIYLGVEANICSRGNNLDVKKDDLKYFDFIIAGYHYGILHGYCISNFLFAHGFFRTKKREEKLRKRNTEMNIGALEKNKIKILTHPGDKAPVDIEAISKECAKRGVLMEISTHHDHLTKEEIETAKKEDVGFVISSDAHRPQVVGTFVSGVERALSAGLDTARIVNIKEE